MGFAQIMGQDRVKALLQNALQSRKIAHAYLFVGPNGSGRREMAQIYAQALFCERGGNDACGDCLECRKVLHGNHPDLHTITPDGATVKIDQIRYLQKELSYRSVQSGYKVYIIEGAETMTIQASNSLLKFLEEPPSPVVAILLAPSAQAVLPTILSRSQLIAFSSGDREALEAELIKEGKPSLLSRAAVNLASGLQSSRVLVEQNWFADIRNVVIQLGKENPNRFTASLLQAQQQVFKTDLHEHIDVLLELQALWYRDMIYVMTDRHNQMVFPDQEEWITKLAWTRSIDSWVTVMESALMAARRIKAHVSPQLALEQFLVNVREG